MNREIKFRAWSKENNRMIENVLVMNGCYCATYPKLEIKKEHPLMQFIGQEDIYDKEIFEDDILEVQEPVKRDRGENSLYRAVVKYSSEGAYFYLANKNGEFINLCSRMELPEVIGNIYEHPSLLEGDPQC